MTINELNPREIWQNFHLLTQVPRPSGHLQKVQEFLLQWAAERGIEAFKDNAENIVMRKPATPGKENCRTAVMQAHMDMVPQKSDDSTHNFETDPIETWVDGEWLKAKGTTLGADDGIGVAAIMAVFEAKDIEHGPLEALFTYDEETGMSGANALEAGFMTGKTLINLDSEDENQIFIGCAGGMDTLATFRYTPTAAPANLYYATVKVSGLLGGHSGGDIHLGHANANKILTRFLLTQPDLVLASIKGGNLRNAIAREAEATFGIPAANRDNMMCTLNQLIATIEGEVGDIE